MLWQVSQWVLPFSGVSPGKWPLSSSLCIPSSATPRWVWRSWSRLSPHHTHCWAIIHPDLLHHGVLRVLLVLFLGLELLHDHVPVHFCSSGSLTGLLMATSAPVVPSPLCWWLYGRRWGPPSWWFFTFLPYWKVIIWDTAKHRNPLKIQLRQVWAFFWWSWIIHYQTWSLPNWCWILEAPMGEVSALQR